MPVVQVYFADPLYARIVELAKNEKPPMNEKKYIQKVVSTHVLALTRKKTRAVRKKIEQEDVSDMGDE